MIKFDLHHTSSFRPRLSDMDGTIVDWIWSHMNLLTAIATLWICAWAVTNGRVEIAAGIFVVGALGYFLGLIVGASFGAICFAANLLSVPFTGNHLTAAMFGFVGYAVAAWLGYQHSEEKRMKTARGRQTHPNQVLPWDMVNEVRTSLAAVRYLLFPIQDSQNDQIDMATRELSRLENLFHDYEWANQKQIQKGR